MFTPRDVPGTIVAMKNLHRKSRPSFLDRLFQVFDFAKRTPFSEKLD
jgi:hypothetical protein